MMAEEKFPTPPMLDKKESSPLTPTGMAEQQASRLSGYSALLERARRLEEEAAGLRRLAGFLPREMPFDVDEALWKLAISR